jgi:Cd2+/Zn2+-exporting ATPase
MSVRSQVHGHSAPAAGGVDCCTPPPRIPLPPAPPGDERRADWAAVEILTAGERRQVRRQVLPLLFGSGLLGLGLGYQWLRPDQEPVGALLQAAAALCVSLPILREALEGFLARPARHLTEQLVAIAILAAASTGDFVTATLVPLFLELGHLFEERSARGARAAIEGIRALSARRATVRRNGREEDVPVESVAVGERILVRPGETVPVDGRVVQGRSSVDSGPITGESLFEEVGPGAQVFAGTANLDGLLELEATEVGRDTVLGRVIELLARVEGSKTPVLRLLERYAGIYLPLVLAVAGVVLFASGDSSRAIAVLIVACPCALVLAGPAAMVAALTAAARSRALIKSASFLEAVTDVDTLILDKTGTVTAGEASVEGVEQRPADVEENQVLALAASCGRASLHPVSRAAVRAAADRGLVTEEFDSIREWPGEGLLASVGRRTVRLGRRSWLEAEGVEFGDRREPSSPGAWLAEGGRLLGYVALRDAPRQEAQQALERTRALGIERLVLLTGDRRATAERVGRELGFDRVVAEVLPEQKLEVVRAEQAEGRRVMMVGDGINDALALSGADVGVAIGAKVSDVALGGADVALLGADLGALPRLLELAARTRWIVVQNALLGTGLSVLMMGLASAGLVGPLLGAAFHNLGSLLVILNSSRLVATSDSARVVRAEL